jgi:hypothetical protein
MRRAQGANLKSPTLTGVLKSGVTLAVVEKAAHAKVLPMTLARRRIPTPSILTLALHALREWLSDEGDKPE